MEETEQSIKEPSKPKSKAAPKEKKKTLRRLTLKQQTFVKEYIETKGNGVKAALKAYDTTSYDTANAIAVENLQKPSIIQEMKRAADKVGLTPERINRRLNEIMDQDKYVVPATQAYAAITGLTKQDVQVNIAQLDKETTALVLAEVRKASGKIIDIT